MWPGRRACQAGQMRAKPATSGPSGRPPRSIAGTHRYSAARHPACSGSPRARCIVPVPDRGSPCRAQAKRTCQQASDSRDHAEATPTLGRPDRHRRDNDTMRQPARHLAGPPTSHVTRAYPVFSRSRPVARSEEHTSELQSLMRLSYAVFCLKKKKKLINKYKHKYNEENKKLTYIMININNIQHKL